MKKRIVSTCGRLYEPLERGLTDYPIPTIRLSPGEGRLLLDAGCGWGRWSIAARRSGYRVLWIDPSLATIRAAHRVARQLGLDIAYAVGDARFVPLPDASVDIAFSYSVLQHFSKEDAQRALAELGRVLRPGGVSLAQMPNAFGLRNAVRRLRAGPPRDFDVRYWTPGELRRAFESRIGRSRLEVDGFFSLNVQASHPKLLAPRFRAVVRASEALRRASRVVRPLVYAADSLYVRSTREER